MSKKTKIADLPEFDITEHLNSDEDIAAYLTMVIEENNPSELAHALGVVARARGMTEIAKASGGTRRCGLASPRFDDGNWLRVVTHRAERFNLKGQLPAASSDT